MHCKSLWIKASAKCINVNVNVSVAACRYSLTNTVQKATWQHLVDFAYVSESEAELWGIMGTSSNHKGPNAITKAKQNHISRNLIQPQSHWHLFAEQSLTDPCFAPAL